MASHNQTRSRPNPVKNNGVRVYRDMVYVPFKYPSRIIWWVGGAEGRGGGDFKIAANTLACIRRATAALCKA